MHCFSIVDLETCSILHKYEAPSVVEYGGPWGNPDAFAHIQVPEDLDPECIKAERDPETGDIIVVTDHVKVQEKAELTWASVRAERNRRLAECDWTRVDDAPLTESQKEDWRLYRVALRDLPSFVVDPFNVTWPTPPM